MLISIFMDTEKLDIPRLPFGRHSCLQRGSSLAQIVGKLLLIPYLFEIIIVDDCSTDRSAEVACALGEGDPRVRLAQQPKNAGKTAALKTGFALTRGDIVIVQDADLRVRPGRDPARDQADPRGPC